MYWVQVNPPIGTNSMPRTETAEIIAITDQIAAQFGMHRLTQVENDQFEAETLASIEKPRLSLKAQEQIIEAHFELKQDFPVLARYRIDHRDVGLIATQIHTYYLTISYSARGKYRMREGSISVSPYESMPNEHKILKMAKQALGERFGYNRVFIGYYHPFNW